MLELTGMCSVCGCTEDSPCPGGCIWANAQATLCSRCARDSEPPFVPTFQPITMCEACLRDDHANCGLQGWCQCDDPEDGANHFEAGIL